jgi:CPA2 family monovalent cation:H+ antiporter-2
VRAPPPRDEVLLAAGAREARVLVASGLALRDVMRLCMTARRLNPRIEIVAAAASPAESAWLKEFGARHVCDAVDEQAAQLADAARSI